MDLSSFLAISSGVIAAFLAVLNWLRWRQEKKKARKDLEKLESDELVNIVHSEMTKESVAIKGASEAVTLMERMLAVAAASNAKLQERVIHLEEDNESLRAKIRDQDIKIRDQAATIEDLRCRLEALEKKDSHNG